MKVINRKLFLDWVLNDKEDVYSYKKEIKSYLLIEKPFNLEELFKRAGFCPGRFVLGVPSTKDFFPNQDCRLETLDEYIKREIYENRN